MAKYDFNTSALIRDALPEIFTTSHGRTIHILKYPLSMECTFQSMKKMLDDVWSQHLSVFQPSADKGQTISFDLVVHMGMRQSEDRICFESVARRDRMNFKGLDGKGLPAEYDDLWAGLSEILESDLDISKAAGEVARQYPVRIRFYRLLRQCVNISRILNHAFQRMQAGISASSNSGHPSRR